MPTKIHAHIDQVVLTTGNQSSIGGVKDFTSRPTVNGTGILLSGESPNFQLPNTIVYTTGNQNVSGLKTFLNPVQVGTGSVSFIVSENGNVGINTETPLAKLHVSSGSVIFENESSDPVLRITQRGNGTGHALLVEDSNNPDSSPFYIDRDGNINTIKSDTAIRLYTPSGAHNRIGVDFGASGESQGLTRLWGIIQDPQALTQQNLVIKRLNAAGEPSVIEFNQNGNHFLYDNWSFTNRPAVNGTGLALAGEFQNNTIISGVVYSAQVNVKNGQNHTIYKGQPVYIKTAQGGNLIVGLASNTGESTSSKTLGLVAQDSLDINASGTVITDGLLERINVGSAVAGDPVWLGTSGDLLFGLTNKPVGSNHLVYLGVVTREGNHGEIFVKVQNGYELNELHDVFINTPLSGDSIVFENNLWVNKKIDYNNLTNKPEAYIAAMSIALS